MEGVRPTTQEHSMDKTQYDRPDDTETQGSRALIFLGMAAVVIGVFYFGYYR
jgi:hypothetical protein